MEILLIGEQIPARRALEMGLVSKVVPRTAGGAKPASPPAHGHQ